MIVKYVKDLSMNLSINNSNLLRTVSSLAVKKCKWAISKKFAFHQLYYHQKLVTAWLLLAISSDQK